jgi:hypothetical protein
MRCTITIILDIATTVELSQNTLATQTWNLVIAVSRFGSLSHCSHARARTLEVKLVVVVVRHHLEIIHAALASHVRTEHVGKSLQPKETPYNMHTDCPSGVSGWCGYAPKLWHCEYALSW